MPNDTSPITASVAPCDLLRQKLPHLPGKLRAAGRYVVEHEFDATTRSMRDIAAAAQLQPASFTRLAQAMGQSGWNEFRQRLIEAQKQAGPFSDRLRRRDPLEDREDVVGRILESDAEAVRTIMVAPVHRAAQALSAVPRIWVAGFRSCRSVATLFHYQMRLFRPDDMRLVGGTGPEDCDFGAFRPEDAVLLIGFDPYSTLGMLTAQAARNVGCMLITVADSPTSPIAEGADYVLLFDAGTSPAFFPSLIGAIATVQALAATIFELGGDVSTSRLRDSETRLSALSQYVAKKSP